MKIIATYVCWDFHEIEPGKFDFTGVTNSRRNHTGFLSLLKSRGFKAIIRPGPYIYSEWENLGVLAHAAGYHRLHAVYLKKAAVYIKEVSKVIKPFLAANGGNIILYQPDNEIDPFFYRHHRQLGLFSQAGPFKEFLKKNTKAWRSSTLPGTKHTDLLRKLRLP